MSDETPPWESGATPPWESKNIEKSNSYSKESEGWLSQRFQENFFPKDFPSIPDADSHTPSSLSGAQPPITNQDALDMAMMIPAFGAEAAVLKGGSALENVATRAMPKVAQFFGEHPFIASAPKVATAGSAGGATYGVGTGRDVGDSAIAGGVGAVGMSGLSAGVSEGYSALKNYLNRATPEAVNNTAVQKILNRFQKDQKTGGISAQQAMELVDESRKTGKPMALADTGGINTRKLAGTVARAPGESSGIAQGFLNQRDAEASKRLTGDVNKYLSSESGRKTTEALAEMRSVEGKPLFEDAYKGGSMAPLEHQFGKVWKEATANTSAIQKEADAVSSRVESVREKVAKAKTPSEKAAWEKDLQSSQAELQAHQAKLAQTKMEEAEAHSILQQAQKDKSANAPGAIWNPRIQRFLDLPIVQKGIQQGIKLEKQNAAAEGRAFNPTEYAIVGTNGAGEPIVGKVPNMRLLASAKEGLDGILESKEMRDELTGRLTKEGVSVDKVRRALLKELKEANPKYAQALDSWAGHSQSMQAIRYGRRVFNENPEEIAAEVSQMSSSEKEFAKLGVADIVRERVLKTGFGGDEAKAIIRSEWGKMQLRPFFKSDSEFNSFVKAVTDERNMFETKTALVKGSQTAEREADDADSKLKLAKAGFKAAIGNPTGALKDAFLALVELGRSDNWKNQKINEAVAKILFNPNIKADDLLLPVVGTPKQGMTTKVAPYAGMAGLEFLTGGYTQQ